MFGYQRSSAREPVITASYFRSRWMLATAVIGTAAGRALVKANVTSPPVGRILLTLAISTPLPRDGVSSKRKSPCSAVKPGGAFNVILVAPLAAPGIFGLAKVPILTRYLRVVPFPFDPTPDTAGSSETGAICRTACEISRVICS